MAPGSRLQELTAKYMQNPRRFFVPLANEYRRAGDLDGAIALCREHLPAQPGHMSGHIVLGRAYYEKGDRDAARDVFLTSVALDDENLIALRHLGDIAREGGESAAARGWYARVLDADPENREIEQLLRSLDADGTDGVGPAPVDATVSGVTAPAEGTPGDLTSALADPTPPGLRAIVGGDATPPFDAELVRSSDAMLPLEMRPLETLDLSTLGHAVEAELVSDATGVGFVADSPGATPAEEFGITVEGGVGFGFGELDELVDAAPGDMLFDALPPIEEANFSAGVTPSSSSPVSNPDAADDILSRPVFGAMASFASWRTAQERETPTSVPVTPPAVAYPASEERDVDDGTGEPSWESPVADGAPTAPEFVTETMAALYAQQGFTRQALDVYRALLARNPDDVGLTMKVIELQAVLDRVAVDSSLQADADNALQFGDLDDDTSTAASLAAGPERSPADPLDEAFGTAWHPSSSAVPAGGDDWFSDDPDVAASSDSVNAGEEIFGLAAGGFAVDVGTLDEWATPPRNARTPVVLASVFEATAITAADGSAAEMLAALTSQMVGRLPKEPPTLPVPEVLELPSAVTADEGTGASPAPLLSFDRFFSGSGSPPRQRIDTPMRQAPTPARDVPVAPSVSPSLSPTFGGVPVIPPPRPTVAPTWAGFDQFVPPAAARPTPPPTDASAPTVTPSSATGAFWTPAAVPVIPPPPPTARREDPPPGKPVELPATPSPVAHAPAASDAQPAQPRTPPSEFHRWLEGLS